MCFNYSLTYQQQQNIWHRKGVNLSFLKLQSILAVVNLFVHNNMTISYYIQINSIQLKIEFSLTRQILIFCRVSHNITRQKSIHNSAKSMIFRVVFQDITLPAFYFTKSA